MSRGTSGLTRYRRSGLVHLAWQLMFLSCQLARPYLRHRIQTKTRFLTLSKLIQLNTADKIHPNLDFYGMLRPRGEPQALSLFSRLSQAVCFDVTTRKWRSFTLLMLFRDSNPKS